MRPVTSEQPGHPTAGRSESARRLPIVVTACALLATGWWATPTASRAELGADSTAPLTVAARSVSTTTGRGEAIPHHGSLGTLVGLHSAIRIQAGDPIRYDVVSLRHAFIPTQIPSALDRLRSLSRRFDFDRLVAEAQRTVSTSPGPPVSRASLAPSPELEPGVYLMTAERLNELDGGLPSH